MNNTSTMTTAAEHTLDLRSAAREVMLAEGFEPDFPPEVEREVSSMTPPHSAGGNVRDLRGMLWSSIDNRSSRDLDQVEVAERRDDDVIRVLIGIADVDVLVHRGSATDTHASVNTTSVYTGIAVFPMLPERLSTALTSLNPNEDRLAVVVTIDVAADGSVVAADAFRALVHNYAKLVYVDVDAWLRDGKAAGALQRELERLPELEGQLRLQAEAARRLQAFRREHGALDLETVEAQTVAVNGKVIDVELVTHDRARDLIENFMVAANSAVARWLVERRIPALRRVVRAPKKWDRLVQLAADMGVSLPAEPDNVALGHFLMHRKLADPAHYADLSLTVVKLLGPGEYILERRFEQRADGGHFGLGAAEYTHSTAPNRRFVDLVIQRLIKGAEAQTSPYTDDELQAIARHCTEQEDAARKVERTIRKRAAAVFMADRVGDSFVAVVTGASKSGTYVRLLRPPVEGRVVRGAGGLDVGDTIRVRLLSVDARRGYIDFENTAGEATARKLERSRRKRREAVRLASRIGDEFDAVVTKAAPDGTYVRLPSESAEGRVVHGYPGLTVGQHIRVRLEATDSVHGFIDFEYVPGVEPRKRDRVLRKQEMAATLRDKIGERFDAQVTGVTEKATWVRTLEPRIEGRLVRGFRGAALGDRIGVVLLATDPVRGWIDFAREGNASVS
jgi:VacB/RNase II family 3'-5' exoribonuclease